MTFFSSRFVVAHYYTRIRIWRCDTLDFQLFPNTTELKILGDPGNSLQKNTYRDRTGTAAVGDGYCFTSYAAGLGMLRENYSVGEEVGTFILTGYIRNGIQHGTVESDNAFGVTVAIHSAKSQDQVLRSTFRFTGKGFPRLEGISKIVPDQNHHCSEFSEAQKIHRLILPSVA